ncbi:uncharacterized protein KD926_001540 [Aspergillus affinis]|uniref:uncharacterized protein n=1 Tax=Aspergillus affinis TaxID=1070780 RepID=UPI0022FEF313|nr:uncharacterized protein KD926_001540 [Aspergillus affinis]KAI9044309.1 hypothetical protein KD926_001540 [Aspergillus affinis]
MMQNAAEQDQLEKCKVALHTPFLTFQTVKEQREERQNIRRSNPTALFKGDARVVADAKDDARATLKELANTAVKRQGQKYWTPLSRYLLLKATGCLKRAQGISGNGKLDSQTAIRWLRDTVAVMGENRKSSSGQKSSSKGSSRSRKDESSIYVMEAIEYLIDCLSLVDENDARKVSPSNSTRNDQRPSSDGLHGPPSQDPDNKPHVPVEPENEGKKVGLHQQRHKSRTLDQYFYSSLPDTLRRDADQVIRRYQARKCSASKIPHGEQSITDERNIKKTSGSKSDQNAAKTSIPGLDYQDDFKICMVDQLWLWVLDDKSITTCFPHTSEDLPRDGEQQDSLLDRIRDHINRDMRPQIRTVYHLAALIVSYFVSSIDECQAQTGEGPETLFDMFSGSIGSVADQEVKLFNSFKSGLGVDGTYLSLEQDIELLEEIKDIRDELNILERIFDEQKDLTQKLFSLASNTNLEDLSTAIRNDQALQYYHQRADVGLRLDRIRKMDEDAKISYDATNYLLDLKQKHANVMGAKAAREQTEETADH